MERNYTHNQHPQRIALELGFGDSPMFHVKHSWILENHTNRAIRNARGMLFMERNYTHNQHPQRIALELGFGDSPMFHVKRLQFLEK